MMKRTINKAQGRKVAKGFNTWKAFVNLGRRREGEIKNGVRMVVMCMRRMENRERNWAFQRWAEEKDRGRIGELARKVGDERMRRAIRSLALLVAGKEGRIRARGFRTMKEDWEAAKRRANMIKGCYYRWRKSALGLAFVGWKDKIVASNMDRNSRKMGGENGTTIFKERWTYTFAGTSAPVLDSGLFNSAILILIHSTLFALRFRSSQLASPAGW